MATAGTLSVNITADPTGMIRGFGRSQTEMKKFERSLNTSTRSISSAFTNMAVDFAASGEVGSRGLKRMAESAIGLAGIFGPAGLLVSGIGVTLVTLLNFHTRAQEAAEKTRAAYKNLLGNLTSDNVQKALEDFAADPKLGGRIQELTRDLEKFQKARVKAAQSVTGRELIPALDRSITGVQAQLDPLIRQREELRGLFREIAVSERGIEVATTAQGKADKARLERARELLKIEEHLADLRASGPAFRAAVSEARLAARTPTPMPAIESAINAAIAPQVKIEGLLELDRVAQELADSITSPFAQLKAGINTITAGFANLRGAMQSAAAAALSAAANMGAILAGKIAGGSFLGQLGSAAGGALGSSLLGPLGGVIGGVAGALVGRAVGGIAKGIGKLFGFGKKRGPSPEELAAQRLRELADAAREAMEALTNIPEGFKIALARNAVADPRGPGGANRPRKDVPGDERTGEKVPRGGRGSFAGAIITVVANSPAEFLRQMERGGYERDKGGVSGLKFALMPAR